MNIFLFCLNHQELLRTEIVIEFAWITPWFAYPWIINTSFGFMVGGIFVHYPYSTLCPDSTTNYDKLFVFTIEDPSTILNTPAILLFAV